MWLDCLEKTRWDYSHPVYYLDIRNIIMTSNWRWEFLISLRYCQDIVLILEIYLYIADVCKILLRHYPYFCRDIAMRLPIYFKDIAEILPRYCSNTGNILIYHRYEILMIYFRNTAEILVRYHKNIFILWRYGLKNYNILLICCNSKL